MNGSGSNEEYRIVLTDATPEQFRKALEATGFEILAEGGSAELAEYLGSRSLDEMPECVAVTWFMDIRELRRRGRLSLDLSADPA